MLSRECEGEPHRTHLRGTPCWEQLRNHTKRMTITRNYSLRSVGKGALYLAILALHSTVPLIATLPHVHITFGASCHILLSCAQAIPLVYSTALKIKQLWNLKALKMVLFAHKWFLWGVNICRIFTRGRSVQCTRPSSCFMLCTSTIQQYVFPPASIHAKNVRPYISTMHFRQSRPPHVESR